MGAVLTERKPKARKRHACTLCGRLIEPGTTYRFYTYAGDGTVWTHREHLPCAALFYDEWWDGSDDVHPDRAEFCAELDARDDSATDPSGGAE